MYKSKLYIHINIYIYMHYAYIYMSIVSYCSYLYYIYIERIYKYIYSSVALGEWHNISQTLNVRIFWEDSQLLNHHPRGPISPIITVIQLWVYRLQETSIAPENSWLEYDPYLFLNVASFQVRTACFQEGVIIIIQNYPSTSVDAALL